MKSEDDGADRDVICIGRVSAGAGVYLDGEALEKAGCSHYRE